MDYIVSNLWLFWTIMALVCLILELSTGTFYIICFAVGAVASVFASLLGVSSFVSQVLIFAFASVISIFVVRPVAVKFLHGEEKARKSNVDALIDRIGVVSQTIEQDGFGRVKIDGDDWKAVSEDGRPICAGSKVIVTKIDSIIITVKVV